MPKKLKFEVFLEEYDQASELPEDSQTLITRARENPNRSYAPFSKFQVGAAVLLANGSIVDGANQENSAFPSGMCAERVALFTAACNFPEVPVVKIAISASSHEKFTEIIRPCGACLQVMADCQTRQKQPMEIIMENAQGNLQVASSVDMLLPFTFSFNPPHQL